MRRRCLQQQRYALVGGLLVLDADAEPDVRERPIIEGIVGPIFKFQTHIRDGLYDLIMATPRLGTAVETRPLVVAPR